MAYLTRGEMEMRRFTRVFGSSALMLLIGIMSITAGYAKDDTIKIGVLLPLSGRYADAGISTVRGIKMAINKINASGGIKCMDGKKIDLVVADDGSAPTKVAIAARRLIKADNVSFILGPYSTPEAEAFMPIASRYHVGGVGLQTTIVPTTDYFSTISMTREVFGTSYASVIEWLNTKGADIQTVAITYPNNDYGQQVAKAAATALEADGIKVFDPISVSVNVQDYTPIVLRVKSMDPDAVISVVYFRDGVLLHEARYNVGYTSPIWLGGSSGFVDAQLWDTLSPEVAKQTLTHSFGLAFYSPGVDMPSVKKVFQRAAKVYPDFEVDQSFLFGVQSARFIATALENACSEDPSKVNQAFRDLKFKAGDPAIVLPFISGDAFYKDNGTLAGTNAIFVQWKDGKKFIVYPPPIATAEPVF